MANQREADLLEEAKLARMRAETARDPTAKTAWLAISENYEVLAELAVLARE